MSGYPFARAVGRDGGIDRIVCNGVDVTRFRATSDRDASLRVPGYTTTEPYAYGSSQPLVILRTNCNEEPYGAGELGWLKKDARIQYQRVFNYGTENEEVVTDYRGIISAVRTSSREWVAEIGGELSYRASVDHKPRVMIRDLTDLGSHMFRAAKNFGFTLTPSGGPDTNLPYPNEGDMSWLAWMNKLSELSQTADVNQRALMPTVWGGTTWEWEPKDTTTIAGTVYADGAKIVLDLVDDRAEQPNIIYGTGVSPSGERWSGGRIPGFFQGTPAPYPFNDDSDFGVGTSNGDTDTGDGITVLRVRLKWFGFLNDGASSTDPYDSAVADAVDRLNDAAGLPEDGTMTTAAWAALWDTDVVGYSTEGARVFPLAISKRVRSLNYSPTGAIIGMNPDHVPGAVRVAVVIDFGVCEEDAAIRYARRMIAGADSHKWAGTITFNSMNAFTGSHGPDIDPEDFTADDILPARSIRPGMNIRLPRFDAGEILHVSGADYTPGEKGEFTVRLTVDSGAKDLNYIVQALARNAESKRNIYREWQEQNRGLKPASNFVSRDKLFGKLAQNVAISANRWNKIDMVMGQSGSVNRTDIRLTEETEFCVVVLEDDMSEAQLDELISDPFSYDGDGRTQWEHEAADNYFADDKILYLNGQGQQPAGYWWKLGYKVDPDSGNMVRTTNPLTGTLLNGSSWSYHSDPTNNAVVHMFIYPRDDCSVKAGRLFAALEDDVT